MQKQNNNKVKTLVFGRGQIAGFINEYFDDILISDADITKIKEIENDIKKYKPESVINTAAITSLEACEQDKLGAFNVNTLGTVNVWQICQKYGVFMCQFSSGCIFSSESVKDVYKETDVPNPKSYYSWTKVWSENLLGEHKNLLIVRPRVIISSRIDKRNTICKWMVYSHFITDENSVTIIEDMLPVLKRMIEDKLSGTYHIVNPGTISPYKVALMLKENINPNMVINTTSLAEINKNLISKRVSTILNSDKLSRAGYGLPNVDESIIKIIKMFKENLNKAGGLKVLDEMRQEAKKKYGLIQTKATTFIPEN